MMDDWISKQRFEDTTCCTTSTAPFPVPTRYYYYDGGQVTCALKQLRTRWWFQIFLLFSTKNLGKWSSLTSIFFQMGWFNHQLEKHPRNIHTNNRTKKKPVTNNCQWRRQEAALAESNEPEAVFLGVKLDGRLDGAPCVLGNMGVPKMRVPNNHGFSYEKMIILRCFGGTII